MFLLFAGAPALSPCAYGFFLFVNKTGKKPPPKRTLCLSSLSLEDTVCLPYSAGCCPQSPLNRPPPIEKAKEELARGGGWGGGFSSAFFWTGRVGRPSLAPWLPEPCPPNSARRFFFFLFFLQRGRLDPLAGLEGVFPVGGGWLTTGFPGPRLPPCSGLPREVSSAALLRSDRAVARTGTLGIASAACDAQAETCRSRGTQNTSLSAPRA
jgi:hypothetical protein